MARFRSAPPVPRPSFPRVPGPGARAAHPAPGAARAPRAFGPFNAAGTLTMIDAVLPGMRDAGWGRLVLISSDVVDQPMPAAVAYPAAKGALETAAKVLAVREAQHGILTNVVRPGFTLTERVLNTPGFGQGVVDAEAAKTPTGRICTPEDVASAVAYLGSAANGHVNGEVLSVAGGRHLTR
ncbi:SDR family NAD(P)-dependent oxidoreductase [Streptosporangium amethystogenes]|uniref:SDR family NAD(P)-dependent oxidoreductase n=1 Tax=Streptosporangium amethystogenes TaxID=2002 RepID=UPI00247FB5B0|nr:SDR family oxidoreductase [Streptosporangium amethystogenes]